MTDDDRPWRSVDPTYNDFGCPHNRRVDRPEQDVVQCLRCGALVEPVPATVHDLGAARRRRAERDND